MAVAADELIYSRETLAERHLAYAPEFHPVESKSDGEVYAHATLNLSEMGRVALVEEVSLEQTGIYQQNWHEYLDGVAENLTTDQEHGDQLKFDGLRVYGIENGMTVNKDGQPVADLIQTGIETSKEAAKLDPKMEVEVERGTGDRMVVEVVDSLGIGEAYVVVSMDPKEALKRDPKFWRNKGYKEGMAIFQVFYRLSETEMLGGAYSVMRSDKNALRQIMERLGAEIPLDVSDNQWTRHGARFVPAKDEIYELGKRLQDEHRQLVNHTGNQISVTELVSRETQLLKEYFDALMVPLAKARHSGHNQPVIADFARRLLGRSDSLSESEVKTLIRVANSKKFTVDNARVMESFIRYAVVEELRKKLLIEMKAKKTMPNQTINPVSIDAMNPQVQANTGQILENLAQNVQEGRDAGREYLGCSPVGANNDRVRRQQDEFGGKAEEKGTASESGVCEYEHSSCYCCPYNSDGTKASKPFVVKARRRADGVAECLRPGCNATLDSKGKANKGTIYERAMMLAQKSKQSDYAVAA